MIDRFLFVFVAPFHPLWLLIANWSSKFNLQIEMCENILTLTT